MQLNVSYTKSANPLPPCSLQWSTGMMNMLRDNRGPSGMGWKFLKGSIPSRNLHTVAKASKPWKPIPSAAIPRCLTGWSNFNAPMRCRKLSQDRAGKEERYNVLLLAALSLLFGSDIRVCHKMQSKPHRKKWLSKTSKGNPKPLNTCSQKTRSGTNMRPTWLTNPYLKPCRNTAKHNKTTRYGESKA